MENKNGAPSLNRRDTVARLLHDRGELVVVSGLGAPSWDVSAAGDSPLNFPLWGGMGGAAMVGLGLALAQPNRRVLVLTGDGEQLMGMGALATVGVQHPNNLSIVVLDNEHYGETGEQPTHTAAGVDLAAIAKACGFPFTVVVKEADQIEPLRQQIHHSEGPLLAVVKIALTTDPKSLPPREGNYLKTRTRQALLGEHAIL